MQPTPPKNQNETSELDENYRNDPVLDGKAPPDVCPTCPTRSLMIFGPPFPRLQNDDPNQPSLPAPTLHQKQLEQPDQQEQDVDPATWHAGGFSLEPAKSEGSCGKALNIIELATGAIRSCLALIQATFLPFMRFLVARHRSSGCFLTYFGYCFVSVLQGPEFYLNVIQYLN